MAEPSGSPVEVLFAEARRRERRRRAVALGVLLALGGLAFGLVSAAGGPPPPRPGNGASSGNTPGAPGTAAGHFTFRQRHRQRYVRPARGCRDRRTGQGPRLADDAAARRRRRGLRRRRPPHLAGDDRVLLARPLRRLQLGQPAGGPGFRCAHAIPSASTAAGLRIGDDVAQARRIYGSAFVVLFSQGGSWRVTTSTGMLDGYLTAVPDRPTPPARAEGRRT